MYVAAPSFFMPLHITKFSFLHLGHAMKTKLSFEELPVLVEDAAGEAAEPVSEEEGTSGETFLSSELVNLDQSVEVADGLGAVAQAMEGYVPSRTNKASTAALDAALRGFMRASGLGVPAPRQVALEGYLGYPTQERLKSVAMENAQAIRDTFKMVLAKIREIIAKIIAWFKQTFSIRTARSRRLHERAKVIEAAAAQAPKTVQVEREVTDEKIGRYLTINGALPTPSELVHGMHEHTDQMRLLLLKFAKMEDEALAHLKHAMESINADDSRFDSSLNEARRCLYVSNIGKSRGQAVGYGQEAILYEEPLFFGGKSIFRTGRTAEASPDDIRMSLIARVSDSSGSGRYPDYSGKGVAPLSRHERENLKQGISRYLEQRMRMGQIGANRVASLEAIERKVADLMNKPDIISDEAIRARAVMRVLKALFKLMELPRTTLNSYDDRILDAALVYSVESESATA
jgi:hypothetical protein